MTIVFYTKIRIQWYITLHVWPSGLFANLVQSIEWAVNLDLCLLQKRSVTHVKRTQNVRNVRETRSFDLMMEGHVVLFTFSEIEVVFDWLNKKVVRYNKLTR